MRSPRSGGSRCASAAGAYLWHQWLMPPWLRWWPRSSSSIPCGRRCRRAPPIIRCASGWTPAERMSVFLGLLDALLTAACGAVLAGLVGTHLTLVERLLIAVTSGVILGSALTYGLALFLGLNVLSVLAGPALVGAAGVAVSRVGGDPRSRWGESWSAARRSWREHPPRVAMTLACITAAAFALLFAHAAFTTGGELDAGYPTVW